MGEIFFEILQQQTIEAFALDTLCVSLITQGGGLSPQHCCKENHIKWLRRSEGWWAAALAPAVLSSQILGAEVLFPSARVMVLHAGQIVEFDSPEELLMRQGIFSAMAKDAGITAAETTAL